MPGTLYKAIVVEKEGHEIEFVSTNPDRYIESPGPTAEYLTSLDALARYMDGKLPGQPLNPLKYTRRWLKDLKRSDWASDVRFEEVEIEDAS